MGFLSRFLDSKRPLHSTRSSRNHLDDPQKVRLRRRPHIKQRISVPFVSFLWASSLTQLPNCSVDNGASSACSWKHLSRIWPVPVWFDGQLLNNQPLNAPFIVGTVPHSNDVFVPNGVKSNSSLFLWIRRPFSMTEQTQMSRKNWFSDALLSQWMS